MPTPGTQGVHKRSLLRDHAYESIRDAIIDGTFLPGERLRDTELEGWLGISRTPIREALLRLERARLVVSMPGRATLVAPVDLETTIGAQQVAAAMHELAARLATPRLSETHVAELVEANVRFAKALDRHDIPAAMSADDEFHGLFVAHCANPIVPEVLERVVPVLRRVERMRFASFGSHTSVKDHDAIIEHVRAGDSAAAAAASRDNWLSLRYTFSD